MKVILGADGFLLADDGPKQAHEAIRGATTRAIASSSSSLGRSTW
jgi:hypothetical protein